MKTRLLLVSSLIAFGFNSQAQWNVQNSNFSAGSRGINSITLPNDSTGWAVGYDGSGGAAKIQEYVKTTNGGTTWTQGTITVPNPATFGIANISPLNGDTAWAALFDENGTDVNQGIYRTNDGGANWTRQATAAYGNGSFTDVVYFWDKNNGVAIGDPLGGYYEIYTTTDGGTTWVRTPNTGNQLSCSPAAEWGLTNSFATFAGTIWFGTDHGRVFKSTDKGLTWTVATTPFLSTTATQSMISGLAFRDANNGLVAKKNATTTKFDYAATTDGGTTWTSVTSTGFNYGGDFCWVPGTSTYVSVGASYNPAFKGSSMSTDDGATWLPLEDTAGVPQRTAVAFYSATLGYSGSFNDNANPADGGMYKWTGALIPYPMAVNSTKAIASSVAVYPNPTAGFLNIALNGFAGKKASVKIFNVIGEQVYSSENVYETPVYTKHIDLSALQAGVYVVTVNDGTQSFVQRITKQ